MTENAEQQGVLITNKDIWIELVRVRDEFTGIRPVIVKIASGQDDHEKRIRKLERMVWTLPSSLILSASAVAIAYIQTHK